MTLDEALKTIAKRRRSETRKETAKIVFLYALILLVMSFAVAGWGLHIYYENIGRGTAPEHTAIAVTFFCGGIVILIWAIGILLVRHTVRDLERTEQFYLQRIEEHPDESHHAGELFEAGYYELALAGYEKQLTELFEAVKQREEKLAGFFEDYGRMEPWVDGVPRPVPMFDNHDLNDFLYRLLNRQMCLVKLGRETTTEFPGQATIHNIFWENQRLYEKYWSREGNGNDV